MFDKKLIYDVGLSNGDDTAHYLSLGFNVIAIEADPVQVEKATEKFQAFIAQGRLKILNIGVASEDGEFEFYINEVFSEWNSFDLSIASRDGLPWHSIKIKSKSFENIIRENGVPYYLKVDIEGHDYLCVRDLDKNNLPQFISVEVNHPGLIDSLAEKGFTMFKLIFQYNLAHLDLPPNKYFRRWSYAYKLRQWNNFPIKVFRKFGGNRIILWLDKQSIPPYSRKYKKGSSGGFGDMLGGKWYNYNCAMEIYNYYYQLFHYLPQKKDYGFWVDVHARW